MEGYIFLNAIGILKHFSIALGSRVRWGIGRVQEVGYRKQGHKLYQPVFSRICRHLRDKSQKRMMINLCISLLLLYIVFAAGIKKYPGETKEACTAVAALLHYLTLSSIGWMLAEAVTMFINFAHFSFISFIKLKARRAAIFAWGKRNHYEDSTNMWHNFVLRLRAHSCQDEKVNSLHDPAIKFIGQKQLVYPF